MQEIITIRNNSNSKNSSMKKLHEVNKIFHAIRWISVFSNNEKEGNEKGRSNKKRRKKDSGEKIRKKREK